MSDTLTVEELDARLAAIGGLMDTVQFAALCLRIEPDGQPIRLIGHESLPSYIDKLIETLPKTGARLTSDEAYAADLVRVWNIHHELRTRLGALDAADPAGIVGRRKLRELKLCGDVTYPILHMGSHAVRLDRVPSLRLDANRTPAELDAMAEDLRVQRDELLAIKRHGVDALNVTARQEKAVHQASESPEPPIRQKRSTARGDGEVKLLAALSQHHKYAEGGCLKYEPIGSNELARQAKVAESTASEYFSKWFGSHTDYKAMCANGSKLAERLKRLRGEYSPEDLYGKSPEDYPDQFDDD